MRQLRHRELRHRGLDHTTHLDTWRRAIDRSVDTMGELSAIWYSHEFYPVFLAQREVKLP